VPVEEEQMRAALTTLVSPAVDRSCVATVPEVVRSEDALWVDQSTLLLTLRDTLSACRTKSPSPSAVPSGGWRRPPLASGGPQFTITGAVNTMYIGSVSFGSVGL
jgi:hypothetical protein